MKAFITLFPVLLMMSLGVISRLKNWITPVQKEGINSLVFNILFPVLIFNILVTADFSINTVYIVGYTFIAFCLTLIVGKAIGKVIHIEYPHFSHFLLTTCEGGSVALPLYISIMGAATASNAVVFDLAGALMAFLVVPILVIRAKSGSADIKSLIINTLKNSFVIAVILGLFLNLSGIYSYLSNTVVFEFYNSAITYITNPITSLILFTLGYDLKVNVETIPSIMKLLVLRVVLFGMVIGGFFIIFPTLMADPTFSIAVLLYFMAPTGFALPAQFTPLFKEDCERNFTSAFISVYMIVELIVYAIIAFVLV